MKNSASTCILTTIFPMPKEYVADFFRSLSAQSISDFELVIVNDLFDNLDPLINEYANFKCIVLKAGDTPIENRERLVSFAIQNQYETIIFADSDDKFSENRVEVVQKYLCEADIVINDVSTFMSNISIDSFYFSEYLEDRQKIKIDMIKESNIFGLSNTAMKKNALNKIKLPFPSYLVALDWYIYSQLLLLDLKAIFTNKCITFYRQHENNLVGIGTYSKIDLINILNIRKIHFQAMLDLGHTEYRNCIIYNDILIYRVRDNKLQNVSRDKKNPFWWEID